MTSDIDPSKKRKLSAFLQVDHWICINERKYATSFQEDKCIAKANMLSDFCDGKVCHCVQPTYSTSLTYWKEFRKFKNHTLKQMLEPEKYSSIERGEQSSIKLRNNAIQMGYLVPRRFTKAATKGQSETTTTDDFLLVLDQQVLQIKTHSKDEDLARAKMKQEVQEYGNLENLKFEVFAATREGDVRRLRPLLEQWNATLEGGEISAIDRCKDTFGRTPLHWVALGKCTAFGESASPHAPSTHAPQTDIVIPPGRECKNVDCIRRNVDTFKLLYKFGANPDTCNPNKTSALGLAAGKGNDRVVEELIKVKADLNMMSKGKWTALHMASTNGHRSTVELLIRAGAHVIYIEDQIKKQNPKSKIDETCLRDVEKELLLMAPGGVSTS
eukprot:gene20267-24268_t